ncbi:HNH endonuclease signature motif containing protein [Polyangium jinanense]|uniref:HNH endonuclease n=1 Tax=Polyangium jinanense TaxID=2829994 RepID=A0A9X3X812_9BACT|nr:HNH endonuclease signature motif containing protein [Polyangium jinanense]MDC3985917.1 HNH endonuclease [Polyangium jinanense]
MAAVEHSLASSEQTVDRADETYGLTERDMALMHAMAVDVLERGNRAARDLDAAAGAYNQAAALYGTASVEFDYSADAYETAAAKYREVTITLIAAAASDLFLRGVCGRSVSTRKYRETLRAQGVNLEGKDIDHIIPRSRGGPDMPWNYNPLDASINRSLQANGMWWKLMNYPLETMNALAKYASYLLMC